MNTNQLKRFAKEARIKLLDQIGRKMDFVLSEDAAILRGKEKEIQQLKNKIQQLGKTQVVENVAYTWFNRLMALRFMDANGYNMPKIVTPLQGMSNPEILQNALAGTLDDDLSIDRQRINELLDGKTAAADAQTEAYKMLLVAACNLNHKAMPFMFERISDYTELLLPDDLLSEFSIVADVRNGMSDEDCQQEEVIGWLYQFYIADKKDKVINAKKKYKTEELPEATQLFTPHWMVKYTVENTLGTMWLEARPNSNLKDFMKFYIEPNDKTAIPARIIKSPEEIKFLDPASGSAHILVYAFELFTKIYEEEGYNASDIPNLIIEKNLFGLEIDDRAASIGCFALTMKATAYRKRHLRNPTIPRIYVFQDNDEIPEFSNAKALGSLIRIDKIAYDKIKVEENSIFSDNQKRNKELAHLLLQKYDCVVSNPPYVNSTYMNDILMEYVKANYIETKTDLFACFLVRSCEFAKPSGVIDFVCPFVWMFISSYELLRKRIIKETTIQNLIQLEYNAFEPACVPICAFTLRNEPINQKGNYIKLSDFRGHENQPTRTIEAIENPNCGWFHTINQKDFEKIPKSPIGYWLKKELIDSFKREKMADKFTIRHGVLTGDDSKFLRYWHEVSSCKIGFNFLTYQSFQLSGEKYLPINKGGGVRKWFGNNAYIIDFKDNEKHFNNNKIKENNLFFLEGITWSEINTSNLSCRLSPTGVLFGHKGPMAFEKNKDERNTLYALGFLNSVIGAEVKDVINSSISFTSGNMECMPLIFTEDLAKFDLIIYSTNTLIDIAKEEWNMRETSWDFQSNALITQRTPSVKTAFEGYKTYWSAQFHALHAHEEALNAQFIEIYGLQDELTPSVSLSDITILQEEAKIIDNQLVIEPTPVLLQLISYAVGCMFGRYSLDKGGLILANQGETLEDYLNQVAEPSFLPDDDNILPVLDGEWFADDIVGRFKTFLRAAFGDAEFEQNLRYIEDTLGKDIRKYLTKDFYNDHVKRYKKRPIYWLFSSPKGHFKALIYMHRYQDDTCSKLLNDYLQAFITKLEASRQTQTMLTLRADITAREKVLAEKEIERLDIMLKDCKAYEKTLFIVATQKISMDLDDGVKVNYQKFKEVLVPIKGLEKEE